MRLLPVPILLALAACAGSATAPAEGPAAELRAFTGGRTRIVWVQGDGSDPFAQGQNLTLMGLDTDDGRGERRILPAAGSFLKPLLTPDGRRVAFSRLTGAGHASFHVSWDGSGLTALGEGQALAVWDDPGGGEPWVYAGVDLHDGNFRRIVRFRLDAPAAREVVWDKTPVSADSFQLSRDGRQAAGLFPWPVAGVAELPNGALTRLGDGCWTALATVRGPLGWYFDGAHRNLTLVDLRSERRWTVPINVAPGFDGAEAYHPRWTNHARFLVMTGPYNLGGANQARAGGRQVEVYLGRFDPSYSRIEAWHRATRNDGGDAYPDVWIDRADNPHEIRAVAEPGPSQDEARPAAGSGRTVVRARLVGAATIPDPQAILPYRHALVVNLYEVLDVVEGAHPGPRVLAAQWAIRDSQVLPGARRAAGSEHRLVLEPYDAHPELEGERLIASPGAPVLPLYYDVGP